MISKKLNIQASKDLQLSTLYKHLTNINILQFGRWKTACGHSRLKNIEGTSNFRVLPEAVGVMRRLTLLFWTMELPTDVLQKILCDDA